jgi:hypothetical protein
MVVVEIAHQGNGLSVNHVPVAGDLNRGRSILAEHEEHTGRHPREPAVMMQPGPHVTGTHGVGIGSQLHRIPAEAVPATTPLTPPQTDRKIPQHLTNHPHE